MPAAHPSVLTELRDRIERISAVGSRARTVLPFGVDAIDRKLPKGGLAYGALHEIAGGANGAIDGAAAIAFTAGIAARCGGLVLWCYSQPDLFAPSLANSGLSEDRVIFFEACDEASILGCFEEALSHGGFSAVVGELAGLSRVASLRLQMAAESTGTLALAIRRWKRPVDARDFGNPTASFTRWRVTATHSAPLPTRGVGRARWLLELMRARGGDTADFEVDACDDKGLIQLSNDQGSGQTDTHEWAARAAS